MREHLHAAATGLGTHHGQDLGRELEREIPERLRVDLDRIRTAIEERRDRSRRITGIGDLYGAVACAAALWKENVAGCEDLRAGDLAALDAALQRQSVFQR